MPAPIELSFTVPARRRVHPTRRDPGEPTPGAAQSLLDARKRVLHEAGASPRAYALKHVPEAAPLAGALEDVIWRKDGDAAQTSSDPRVEAAAYRMFRPEIREDLVVSTWVRERGVAFAVEALARIDDFDLILVWTVKKLVSVDPERRADGPMDDRNPYYSTPGGSPQYLLARKLRRFLAIADGPSFDAARAVAERLLAGEIADAWVLPAMAYLFPDTPEWADRAITALEAMTLATPSDECVRWQWMRWMLSVPLPATRLDHVLDLIQEEAACPAVQDDNPLYSLVANLGAIDPAAPQALLLPRLERLLAGKGWAKVRTFGEALTQIRSGEVADLMVRHLTHKGLAKSAPEYLGRHADLALPRLVAADDGAKPKKKSEAAAAAARLALAADLSRRNPALLTSLRTASAAPSPAVARVAARTSVGTESAVEARPKDVPKVLTDPPWLRRRPKAKPAPVLALETLPYEEHVAFGPGERAEWLALGALPALEHVARNPDAEAYNAGAEKRPFTFDRVETRRYLLALHELAILPALLAHGRWRTPPALDPLSRVASPRVAPLVARALAEGEEAVQGEARVALETCTEALVTGLIPPAVGKKGLERQQARAALAHVHRAGGAGVLRRIGERYGTAASAALEPIAGMDPLDHHPGEAPAMPDFWRPAGLPRPLLVSGARLPESAVSALGQMLKFTETFHAYAGLAEVRAACSADSLDAFVWELTSAWELAKGKPEQAFAVRAIGHLGSPAALARLVDRIAAWAGTKTKLKMAIAGLEALVAADTDVALMHLGRIAASAKQPELRAAAAMWLSEIARGRRMAPEELEDRIVPELHADAAGAREVLAVQARRLERAMSDGRRWTAAAFRERIAAHPLMARLAEALVWGAYDPDGRALRSFRLVREPSACLVDIAGAEVELGDEAPVGIVHPLHLEPVERGRWSEVLRGLGMRPAFPQLDRETFDDASRSWPALRGTVIPYRRIEKLLVERGWRLYRTHCTSPLHDWSYIERAVDGGRTRVLVGFNFGKHMGDSSLGNVRTLTGGGWGPTGTATTADVLSPAAYSEIRRDMGYLAGASDRDAVPSPG